MEKIQAPLSYAVSVYIGGGSYNETSTPDLTFIRYSLEEAKKLEEQLYDLKYSMDLTLDDDELNVHVCPITPSNLNPLDVLRKELEDEGYVEDDDEDED